MELKTKNPLLKFDPAEKKLVKSLSAAVFVGEHLWLASDELNSRKENSIERLSTTDGLTFENHKSFPLTRLLRLPADADPKADQEIDMEGLDIHDSHLWLLGSHSLKRSKVEADDKGEDADLIAKLSEVKRKGNRFVLARIPLVTDGGEPVLPPPPASGQASPAQQLSGTIESDDLIEAIRRARGGEGDEHLAKFLDIPGKDNGLDIEGLALAGEKVFLGLRGPVLRGWAVVLELSVATGDPARLTLNTPEGSDRPYRKHFLDLAGLGVRDLSRDGEDLLVLAAPTMNLDGPSAIFRWKGALNSAGDSLVRGERLRRVMEIPFGQGVDHAEGFTFIPGVGQPRQILVVYDSPAKNRLSGGAGTVTADVFDLP